MSTQEPNVPYGTTGERLKAFALDAAARERIGVLAARYWEISTYAALVVMAAILRFYNLGARAIHHDESLHAYFGFGFAKGIWEFVTFGGYDSTTSSPPAGYQHVPFMHGPFQFIGNGFMMSVFGDGDYQARLLAATLGTALVFMPFLLRKQLGTIGALAAAAFIAFSPTLTYYSRFTREDIYAAFWTFGIIVFMWRYLATRQDKFLVLTAFFLASSFATKETTFFNTAAFLIFLNVMLAVNLSERMNARVRGRTASDRAIITFLLIFVAWAIAIAWPFLEKWRAKHDLKELPAEGDLIVVMGTLALPQYAALIQFMPFAFGSEWRNRAGETGNLHIAGAEKQVAYTAVFALIALSAVIGLQWNVKRWLMVAAAFWIPFVLLFTTFFSNGEGFFSGMWGSLDYWISQQDVRRGDQPDYYYFVTIPVYEFLPLIFSVAAMAYYMIRGNLRHAMIVAGALIAIVLSLALPSAPHIEKVSLFHIWVPFLIVLVGVMLFPMDTFTRFLMFWLVFTALVLTVAGEKMPWLNVHIALPLAVLAGRFVGDLLENTDLRLDLPKVELFAPFLYAAVASALAIIVFVIVGPFELASFGGWVLALIAGAAVVWAFVGYSRRTAVQVAAVGLIAALLVFTLRAGVLASWGHPDIEQAEASYSTVSQKDYGDVPIELLVYTQTSQDIPKLRDLVAQYARETGAGKRLPVVVDTTDSYSWPWAWYLRRYRAVAYATVNAGYTPPDGAIVFAAKQNAANVTLGDKYNEGVEYHHRRWFPEDYRGDGGKYTIGDFTSDLFSKDGLSNWLDYWVRRTPPSHLGTVDGIAFFPKAFGSLPTAPVGPTVRTEGTQLVIGGSGTAPGQLNGPSDVALGADGSIYVADTNNNRIEKYDSAGNFVKSAGGFAAEVTFQQPWSMTVADDGTVFVADTWNHKVLKLDSDLKKVKEWGSGGVSADNDGDPLKLFGPREIVLAANGSVVITDTGNARLVEFTQDGDPVTVVGEKGTGTNPLQFDEPVGIAVAPSGDIYVADFWNKRILLLGSDYSFKSEIAVDAWGSRAVTDRPYLSLLADGRLLATDPEHGKVLVFAADGSLASEYEVPKDPSQGFARPTGIEADATSVYVVDAAASIVRKIPLTEVAP